MAEDDFLGERIVQASRFSQRGGIGDASYRQISVSSFEGTSSRHQLLNHHYARKLLPSPREKENMSLAR